MRALDRSRAGAGGSRERDGHRGALQREAHPALSAPTRTIRVRTTPAAVLGLGVNGFGVVRALGRHGVPVLGFFQHANEFGRYSRYCHRVVRLASPSREPAAALRAILDVVRELDRPPLLPTSDEFLSFVSSHREELEAHCRFQISDPETVTMMIEKSGVWTLAERFDVPIPPTRFPRTEDDVEAIRSELRFPCIVKPLDTFSVSFPGGAKNVIAKRFEDLQSFFRAYPACLGASVVQQIIQGGDGHIYVCAGYFDAESEPRAIYTGRKIRQYPPDYGVTCYGESVWIPEIEAITIRFLQAIRYRGSFAVEFVRDRSTGAFYLLEVNARSYYHNQLFTDCGINLAYTEYRDLMGEPLPRRAPRQREGTRWLDFQRDLSSFWRKRRTGELSWLAWAGSLPRARSFAYLDPSDWKPFLAASAAFAKTVAGSLLRGGRAGSAHS